MEMNLERNKDTNDEVVLDIEDDDKLVSSSCLLSSTRVCRICHEEEESGGSAMEAPCACSGTLKFAHRECVQRWCDEKGSIVCEICLQNFQPGYTVGTTKALVDVGVTIRGSLEVARLEYQPPTSSEDELGGQCPPTSTGRVSCCRSVAVTFTFVLLLRHMFSVFTLGSNNFGFSLLIVFLLRAGGILLPLFCVMRLISALERIQRYRLRFDEPDDSLRVDPANNRHSQHQMIEIHP